MASVRVVTDSTADMDDGAVERLGIEVVPLTVRWERESYRDGVDLNVDEFYRKLREEKGAPKTSQPSVGVFEDSYRRLLGEAESVVSIHISSLVSGTYSSALAAAQQVDTGRISVVDSRILSYPLGCLVMRVAQLAAEGASVGECVAVADSIVPRLRLIAAMDTLEYLRRGGRVSRFQAFAGNLLSIKPMVHLVDGVITPVDRVRTRAASVRRMAELVLALGPVEELAVLYGDDPDPAEQVMEILKRALPDVPMKMGRTGAVIGAHTGPGVFGAHALLAR